MDTWIFLNLEYFDQPRDAWNSVIANHFDVPTDHALFGALAGVGDVPSLHPPRGLPDPMSAFIHRHYYTEILPDNATDLRKNLIHQWCYEKEAASWVTNQNAGIVTLGDRRFVSNVNAHHESHLTRQEILDACRHSGYDLSSASREFTLVLDFMNSIDRVMGPGTSRTVFWFEN